MLLFQLRLFLKIDELAHQTEEVGEVKLPIPVGINLGKDPDKDGTLLSSCGDFWEHVLQQGTELQVADLTAVVEIVLLEDLLHVLGLLAAEAGSLSHCLTGILPQPAGCLYEFVDVHTRLALALAAALHPERLGISVLAAGGDSRSAVPHVAQVEDAAEAEQRVLALALREHSRGLGVVLLEGELHLQDLLFTALSDQPHEVTQVQLSRFVHVDLGHQLLLHLVSRGKSQPAEDLADMQRADLASSTTVVVTLEGTLRLCYLAPRETFAGTVQVQDTPELRETHAQRPLRVFGPLRLASGRGCGRGEKANVLGHVRYCLAVYKVPERPENHDKLCLPIVRVVGDLLQKFPNSIYFTFMDLPQKNNELELVQVIG
mmetsp:Transcript_11141/g.32644  ORF Transcript_11141/g.32644 Transcript_11141/m.32644 type:complete len:374 (-) Transcript_11141:1617-2738(-)